MSAHSSSATILAACDAARSAWSIAGVPPSANVAGPWNRDRSAPSKLAMYARTIADYILAPSDSCDRRWLRRISLLGVVSLVLPIARAEAAPTPGQKIAGKGGNLGVGVSLGDPMGGSLKWFAHPNHALQADLGWAPLHHGHGRLGVDYLWHPGTFVSNSTFAFLPYLGLGVAVGFWARHGQYRDHGDDDHGGAGLILRAPVLGLGFHWKTVPLDSMLEGSWSPYLVAGCCGVAYTDLPHGDVSFKLRYYF